MRILDDESDKKLDSPETQHAHLSNNDYQKEITICLYDNKNFTNLHPRAIKLIKEDK